MNKVFKVEGLDCAACAAELEDIVSKVNGVSGASVDFIAQKVCFEGEDEDAAREKFRTMVKQAGITLEQLRAGAPGEDAGVTVIKQDDSAVNSTAVSSSRRSSGSSWGGGHPGGFPPHGDFGGGMPPPPPGM